MNTATLSFQKEKAFNKEMKRKLEELKATTSSLRTQKTDLKTKIKGLEATATTQKNREKELEAALAEKNSRVSQMEATLTDKNSHIRQMEERAAGTNPDQMAALMELLQQKEAELEEIKVRFQDYKTTERKSVGSKSTHVQSNNANARPDNAVVEKVTSSSDATPTRAEEKSSKNTTTAESRHPKDTSLEEKQVKSATSKQEDGLQDKTDDAIEDIDDIYGESHSKKIEFPRRNKKFLTNSGVDSQDEELHRIEHPGNSLDQDSDRVRYNKLLEKEIDKVSGETKNKKSIDGSLEKISKHSLGDANKNGLKQTVEDMAGGTAAVKPNMSVNDDGTQQQNKRPKKKKTRSKKKMIDSATTNSSSEVTKEK